MHLGRNAFMSTALVSARIDSAQSAEMHVNKIKCLHDLTCLVLQLHSRSGPGSPADSREYIAGRTTSLSVLRLRSHVAEVVQNLRIQCQEDDIFVPLQRLTQIIETHCCVMIKCLHDDLFVLLQRRAQ